MQIIEMMFTAVCIHFCRDPNNAGWLLVAYCLWYDIRGIRSLVVRFVVEILEGVV
jgi:tryptophan-rich sensory protein